MYEDYLEEFIFKTAKLIAKKLFGKNSDDKADEVVEEEPTADPSEESNANVNPESDDVDEESNSNAEQGIESAKDDETDENEFEILEKQKPSDAVAQREDDPDYGECYAFILFYLNVLKDVHYRSRSGKGTRKINFRNKGEIF